MAPNKERNQELYEKRMKDPIYWSFRKLGKFYNITAPTAYVIFKRERAKNARDVSSYQQSSIVVR